MSEPNNWDKAGKSMDEIGKALMALGFFVFLIVLVAFVACGVL